MDRARDLPTGPTESFRAWWKRTGGGVDVVSASRELRRGGAREEILRRVREATSGGPPRYAGRATTRAGTGDVDLFVERVADYRAVVERCTAAELEGPVAAAVEGCSVVVPDGLEVVVPDAVADDDLSAADLDATTRW